MPRGSSTATSSRPTCCWSRRRRRATRSMCTWRISVWRGLAAELTERAPAAGATEIDSASARAAPTEYDRAKGATQLERAPSRRRALPFVLAGLALLAIGGLIALLAGGGGGGGSKST